MPHRHYNSAPQALSIVPHRHTNNIYNNTEEQNERTMGTSAPDALTNSDDETDKSKPSQGAQGATAPITSEETELLFNALWLEYRELNPQGESAARRRFHRLFDGQSRCFAKILYEGVEARLQDAVGRWTEDDGSINYRYVPSFSSWLERNYE